MRVHCIVKKKQIGLFLLGVVTGVLFEISLWGTTIGVMLQKLNNYLYI